MSMWDGGAGFKERLVNDPHIKSVIWCQQSLNVRIKNVLSSVTTRLFQNVSELPTEEVRG